MNDLIIKAMLLGALSTGDYVPFWMTAGQSGIVPSSSGAVAWIQAKNEFDESKTLQWRFALSGAVQTFKSYPGDSYVEKGQPAPEVGNWRHGLMVDDFYVSGRWKKLTLDLGWKRNELDFMAVSPSLGSLSVTGGHLVWSNNAPTMPGYKLSLSPVAVPFTKQHLWLYGSFGDYRTLDQRYVQDANIHSTKIFLKINIGSRFDFTLGLDHYSIWGGVSPDFGRMPSSFKDYLRIILCRGGGSNATDSDKANVLGDHGGSELLRLDYRGDGWKATAQHEIPYNDKSGMRFQNFPDGVNTLSFSFDDKNKWITDVVYEYHYTRYQSGSVHDDEFIDGEYRPWHKGLHYLGGDNYFNNGQYKSGWTYFGRTIGYPLFFPAGTKDNTWSDLHIVKGVENNRLRAHHIGISGKLFRKAPYRLLLTYSRNYGTYTHQYAGECAYQKPWGSVKETALRQFSAGFQGEVPFAMRFGMLNILYGVYADAGQVLGNKAGFSLGIRLDMKPAGR